MAEKPCVSCGDILPDRARFCLICGSPQTAETNPASPSALADSTATDIAAAERVVQVRPTVEGLVQVRPTVEGLAPAVPRRLLDAKTRITDVYTIEDMIGEGGMGGVYRATDHARKRTVAIKALHSRGGSWMYDTRSLRTYARSSFEPMFRMDGVGFRCAL